MSVCSLCHRPFDDDNESFFGSCPYCGNTDSIYEYARPKEPEKERVFEVMDFGGRHVFSMRARLVYPSQEDWGLFLDFNSRWGYIDSEGRIVIPPIFDDAHSFSEGFARISIDGKDGFIDRSGKVVNSAAPDAADVLSDPIGRGEEDLAFVQDLSSKKFSLRNRQGQLITPPIFILYQGFSEGLAAVSVEEDHPQTRYGYIDECGRMVIPQTLCYRAVIVGRRREIYMHDSRFKCGRAPFWCEVLWGYIDATGRVAIAPQFDTAEIYSEGLACVSKSQRYGFVDVDGKIFVPLQFLEARNFENGLALVQFEDNKWGAINRESDVVIPPTFTYEPRIGSGFVCGRID